MIDWAAMLRSDVAAFNARAAQLDEREHADLRGADLAGLDLSRANIEYADLTGADLTAARVDGAQLVRCRLQGATLDEIVVDPYWHALVLQIQLLWHGPDLWNEAGSIAGHRFVQRPRRYRRHVAHP